MIIKVINTIHRDNHAAYELVLLPYSIKYRGVWFIVGFVGGVFFTFNILPNTIDKEVKSLACWFVLDYKNGFLLIPLRFLFECSVWGAGLYTGMCVHFCNMQRETILITAVKDPEEKDHHMYRLHRQPCHLWSDTFYRMNTDSDIVKLLSLCHLFKCDEYFGFLLVRWVTITR